MKILRIATRESLLALWQAKYVAKLLEEKYPDLKVELVPMTTRGDQLLNSSLAKIGGKGLFIKELETAILENRADIAVHSMKDVGAELPEGFTIAAILERENPYDAFVSNHFNNLNELPENAKVGTCSLRRQLQIKRLRPDLQLIDLRGNVQSRLQKLDDGNFAAIILAQAGLKRLGLENRSKEVLQQLIPAVGQGAIGIECLENSEFLPYLAGINHEKSAFCVKSERLISGALNASCQVPLAVHVQQENEALSFQVRLGLLDGSAYIAIDKQGKISNRDELVAEIIAELKNQGAEEILRLAMQ